MRIIFAQKGKPVAELPDAIHVPRVGDVIFLQLDTSDQSKGQTLYKVLHVAWDIRFESSEDPDLPQFKEAEVYILIEPAQSKTD